MSFNAAIQAAKALQRNLCDAGFPIKSYIFGSVVNDGGAQFDPQNSDLDFVHVLNEDMECISRLQLIKALTPYFDSFETDALRALQRKNAAVPIASHCIITPLERELDIHKDQKKQLLSGKRFLDLSSDDPKSRALTAISNPRDPFFFENNAEAVNAIAFAQKIRNCAAMSCPNGKRMLLPVMHVRGGDPLPKEMMRAAAMLVWSMGGENDDTQREDTLRGLDFISNRLVPNFIDGNNDVAELSKIISVRRGARGKPQKLEPLHQVLIAEMLFDQAKAHLQPTLEMKLSGLISSLNGTIPI
jgi:hypothetical protein